MIATTTPADETVNDETLVQQVLDHFGTADREGRPLPGRPTLLELIPDATEHQLKKAIELAKAIRRYQLVGAPVTAPSAGDPAATAFSAGGPTSIAATSAGDTGVQQPHAGDSTAHPASGAPPAVAAQLPWSTRLLTWAGFVFGAAMSIAANVLHTGYPPTTNHQAGHQDWHPRSAPPSGPSA